jgi:predicted transposase YdaD
MGLSYSTEETETLLRGVRAMNESVTFQAILEQGREQGREQGLEQGREQGLEQGRLQEAVALLFKVGRKQFGAASPSVVTSIEQITDLSRIEQLHERLHEVKSWDELLASRGKGNGND